MEEHARRSRLSLSQLRRLSASILDYEWPGRSGRPVGGKKFTKPTPEEEAKHMLDAAGAAPEEIAEIALRGFDDQRWSYGSRAEVLEPLHPVRPLTSKNSPRSKHVRIAAPSSAKTEARPASPLSAQRPRQLCYSFSASQLTQRTPHPAQQPRKYSIVRELRSDRGSNPNRGVYRIDNSRPPRHRTADLEDQRHIQPLLRTNFGSTESVASDISEFNMAPAALRVCKSKPSNDPRQSGDMDEVDLILHTMRRSQRHPYQRHPMAL